MFGRRRTEGENDLVTRGEELRAAGRHQEAIAWFDRALAINPHSPPALFGKGNALVAIQRELDAAACYDQILALDPTNTKALYSKGCALVNFFHLLSAFAPPEAPYPEAIACFEAAVRHGHAKADGVLFVLRGFGQILRELGGGVVAARGGGDPARPGRLTRVR